MGNLKTLVMMAGAFIVFVAVGPGCGMSGLGSGDMAVVPSAGNGSSNPREILVLAEKSMATAGDERLDYYAPLHLSEAEKHLKKAQNLMIKGKDSGAVIVESEASRQMIAKGLVVKQAVLRQLADVFDMKVRLDKLKADVYERSEYEDQMDHIAKLISYIEKGDQDAVEKKKKDYLDEMIALEVVVVKKKALSEALDVLAKARKNDARKLAPKTWKTAEDTVSQATIFIESFPRDEIGVDKVGLESLRACQHVYFVTQEVSAIKDMGKDDYENLVLDFETKLNRVRLGLSHEDVRHMSLHDQSVALSGAAEALQRNLASGSKTIRPVAVSEPIPSTPVEPVREDIAPPVTATEPVITVVETPSQDVASSVPDTAKETPPPTPAVTPMLPDEPDYEDPQSLNPDDLYLSDEERALRGKKAAVDALSPSATIESVHAPILTPTPDDTEGSGPEPSESGIESEADPSLSASPAQDRVEPPSDTPDPVAESPLAGENLPSS